MKTGIKIFSSIALAALLGISAHAQSITTKNVDVHGSGDFLNVNADIVLDNLKLRSNHQVLVTPIVKQSTPPQPSPQGEGAGIPEDTTPSLAGRDGEGSNSELTLPSILISGRNMHISYERGVLRNFKVIKEHEIMKEVQRRNGTSQTVAYSVRVPLEPWMRDPSTQVAFTFDSCGCGALLAQVVHEEPVVLPGPEPEPELTTAEIMEMIEIPEIEIPNVQIHAGKARVQFEVDRTALHVDPYTCRNGQRIDNREQLQIIDDSVKYALSDPNVELVGIEICGYASPESPYLHNQELASGRSKVLAEYLADRYNIPREKAKYSYVTENWGEFRDMVLESDEITERQREMLLELIDMPATTPADYDHKEWLLKNDSRYKQLYRSKILPQWFPKLRATTFALQTQLKPMTDEQLKEVVWKTPEKMSLNQLFRVARLYEPQSDEFNNIMLKALELFPGDQTAITNAAIAAIARGEYERARELLSGAEPTPAVQNLQQLISGAP